MPVQDQLLNQTRIEMDVLRIAIGKKVFASRCRIEADTKWDTFKLAFQKDSGRSRYDMEGEVRCSFTLADVKEFKYYQPDQGSLIDDIPDDASTDDPPIFFAFNTKPTGGNGLKQYSNSYDGISDRKKYVAVEFRDAAELRHLLDHLRRGQHWEAWITPGAQLTDRTYDRYAKALLLDSKKEAESRRHALSFSSTKSTEDSFVAGRTADEILMVYPFAGDPAAIEAAADGLTEAKGSSMDLDDLELVDPGLADEPEPDEPAKHVGRGHYLTLRVGDYERLEPGEYLNDTIIDFWMQWYDL